MKKHLLIIFILICLFTILLPTFASPIDTSTYINVKDHGAIGDGSTDDSKAIIEAVKKAHNGSKTVYFPDGTYVLSESINLAFDNSKTITFQGADNATITTTDSFEGDMIESLMEHGFTIKGLKFIHKGKNGRIINSHNCIINDSVFESTNTENTSTLVEFAGSNCRVTDSTFKGNNESAYALSYIRRPDKISINDYIIDNTFEGNGNGIKVGATSNDGRPEGLKISGNTFNNTGTRQILVESILHIDISDNTFTGSTGTAIAVSPQYLGVHGFFVTGNNIQSEESCVEIFAGTAGVAVVHIVDNYMHDSEYGVKIETSHSDVLVNNNIFKNIEDVSVSLKNAIEAIVTENVMEYMKGSTSLLITGKDGNYHIEKNSYGNKTNIDIDGYVPPKETTINIYVLLSIIFVVVLFILIVILIILLRKKKK